MRAEPCLSPPSKTASAPVSLAAIRERIFRPALGFNRPADVIKDPDLNPTEKRQILSSWASDGCAVAGRPYLRWMPGSDAPVPLDEVLEALARVEGRRWSARRAEAPTQH